MKALGPEIARFEMLADGHFNDVKRIYTLSLRSCGTTLYRSQNPRNGRSPKWSVAQPWTRRGMDATRAEYVRRGYQEVTREGQ